MSTLSVAGMSGLSARRVAVAAAAVLGAIALIPVEAGAVSERVRKACKDDYFRFCPSYEVGTPQLRTCISQAGKRRALTPRCLNALIDAGEVPRKYLSRR